MKLNDNGMILVKITSVNEGLSVEVHKTKKVGKSIQFINTSYK